MIGIWDSGIGGMTVVRAIEQLLPGYPLIYLGDTAHGHYNTKSVNSIIDYSVENTQFLVKQGARLIVVACNSAARLATNRLRQEFNIPIIEIIRPTVEEALARTRTGRIGIIGTRNTIQNDIYRAEIQQIKPESRVYSKACPLLVSLIEEGWLAKRETKMILRRYLYKLKNYQIDTLVLGCTHYPLLKHLIQPRIGKKVALINSAKTTAQYLKGYLDRYPIIQPHDDYGLDKNRYFITGLTATANALVGKIFDRPLNLTPLITHENNR